jgi:hypothetical protein
MEIILGLGLFLLVRIVMISPFAGEIEGTRIDSLKKAGLY